MFYRIKEKLRRFRFMMETKGILDTPPLAIQAKSDLALLTQLQHKDVRLALIAFKSFAIRVPVGAVYILNDGSLTPDDINLLRRHIPSVIFLGLEEHQSQQCPQGGCWERLLSISRLVDKHYVVQLDSDTVTLDDTPEVEECIRSNRSFVIGTWDNQEIETMPYRHSEAVAFMKKRTTEPHIQLAAESSFNKLKRFVELKYVRGCAGFTGFAKGSFDRTFVEEVSNQMSEALGDRWREWGSEQVMSNIVVSNTDNCLVLPHPKYSDCKKMRLPETVFVHFIGGCRFNHGHYAKLGRKVIANLRRLVQ